MSILEMWAAYCAGKKTTFEAYTSGCDLLAAECAYWEDKGLPVLLRAVEMTAWAAVKQIPRRRVAKSHESSYRQWLVTVSGNLCVTGSNIRKVYEWMRKK